jgi:hypothetical protein
MDGWMDGFDENIISTTFRAVERNKQRSFGSSGVSSLSSHNLLEDAAQAHPDRGVAFNPGPLT